MAACNCHLVLEVDEGSAEVYWTLKYEWSPGDVKPCTDVNATILAFLAGCGPGTHVSPKFGSVTRPERLAVAELFGGFRCENKADMAQALTRDVRQHSEYPDFVSMRARD